MSETQFDKKGRFIINDYDEALPFSSFLPGIAGPMGVPIWVFYVNRGQAIASFGVQDKDSPIMEFQPANKAYQYTPYSGFRTFIKVLEKQGTRVYEPFAPLSCAASESHAVKRKMYPGSAPLTARNPAAKMSQKSALPIVRSLAARS